MNSKFDVVQNKILDKESLTKQMSVWKLHNKRIVFTNGCFDLVHRGHVEYLAKAADLGDILIIGLNTDSSVKRLKGESRPIQDEKSRAILLASFHFVDAVVFFNEDTPYNLIKAVQPNVLVKGSDYRPQEIVGYDIVTQNGGEVIPIDFVDNYSTSRLIEKIHKMDNKS